MEHSFATMASYTSLVLYVSIVIGSIGSWVCAIAWDWTNTNPNWVNVNNPFETFVMTKIYGYTKHHTEYQNTQIFKNNADEEIESAVIYLYSGIFIITSLLLSIVSYYTPMLVVTLVLIISGLFIIKAIKSLMEKINKIEEASK